MSWRLVFNHELSGLLVPFLLLRMNGGWRTLTTKPRPGSQRVAGLQRSIKLGILGPQRTRASLRGLGGRCSWPRVAFVVKGFLLSGQDLRMQRCWSSTWQISTNSWSLVCLTFLLFFPSLFLGLERSMVIFLYPGVWGLIFVLFESEFFSYA